MANVDNLVDAIAKLRWCSTGNRDFSVMLKPAECDALLACLPDKDLIINSLGAKDEKNRVIHSGDPGDEQPA